MHDSYMKMALREFTIWIMALNMHSYIFMYIVMWCSAWRSERIARGARSVHIPLSELGDAKRAAL